MADPFDPGSSDPFSHSPGEVIGRRGVLHLDPAAAGFHAGGPALPRTRPPEVEQPTGLEPHMIGQRLPSAPNLPTQPAPRLVDVETMRATPPAKKGGAPFLERAIDLFRNYPSTPARWAKADPDTLTRMSVEQMKNNILWLYDNTPTAWRDRASQWYDGGNKIITDQAQQYGLSPRATAGVTAVLSPGTEWFTNVSMGERVLRTVLTPEIRSTPMTPEMFALYKKLGKDSWGGAFNEISGKSYDDVVAHVEQLPLSDGAKAEMKAMWVRLYDEAHTPQDYRIISPEGTFGAAVTNKDGTPTKLRWGSNSDIGKAIRMIETNGAEAETLAGDKHKVRNFYNNLLVPNSARGDVTIDTHAVAAALLRPLAQTDLEVSHNFETSPPPGMPSAPGSDITGVRGTYGIYADAYRQAAAERGILPRQMQSITWEAVRGLFPRAYKTPANKKLIDALWTRYRNGQATIEQTRAAIFAAANGIDTPSWAAGAVPAARADEVFQYSGDPRELFELRVYGEPSGYPFSGGGNEPAAGVAPGLTEAALGAGAE